MTSIEQTQERLRLVEDNKRQKYWKRWGPYLSERQWGTVREDYSAGGGAWEDFSHDQSRSRAYRWGEDGLMGISDSQQRLCFSIALWNGSDPILKERLFGLTNSEGNHGEDVKEYYFYLDSTPTHSYMKGLYKYPHAAFPYGQLVNENARRKAEDSSAFEFELMDTGIFNDDRYFDVFVEYAKNSPDDVLIQITVVNRASTAKELHLLPTLWFRNVWSWGLSDEKKPSLKEANINEKFTVVEASFDNPEKLNYWGLDKKWLYCEHPNEMLYTDNETNHDRFEHSEVNSSLYVKDGINNYVVNNQANAVNPKHEGTKVSPYYRLNLAAGETQVVRLRLADVDNLSDPFGAEFELILQQRQQEADEFYQAVTPFQELSGEMQNVQRQAFAGMLWSKQFYHYVVQDWLDGDTTSPKPPENRQRGRNSSWTNFYSEDIISMPDKWEYPWFAAWDLAFHTIPLALIDPDFAKKQLDLLTREWFMHPNGQMPAYEWNFGDVNPPVHAWATWRVYKIEEKMYGNADQVFLEKVFQKLTLYFTWWVNRKDLQGNNLFGGGFLGLDNIGIFDRSNLNIANAWGEEASIEQSDGTSWMGMFCLNLLKIATELAEKNPGREAYSDMASKFFQHFLLIADAMNNIGGDKINIWDQADKFYYDILQLPSNVLRGGNDSFAYSMKIRSMVGLIPMFAMETIDVVLEQGSSSLEHFSWFLKNRQDLVTHDNIKILEKAVDSGAAAANTPVKHQIYLSLVSPDKLKDILKRMLDENEFLSPHGVRALSKIHKDPAYRLPFSVRSKDGSFTESELEYEAAESRFGLFGGNSNWRGPVWFPVNYLIIESLQKYHYYLGDDFKVECPVGSGKMLNLWDVAAEISQRLMNIFLPGDDGHRPVYGGDQKFQDDPHWNNYILFYEYFHGDIGAGIGASHQTGWTGVVAKLIQQYGKAIEREKD
jgi:hypothetical protein